MGKVIIYIPRKNSLGNMRQRRRFIALWGTCLDTSEQAPYWHGNPLISTDPAISSSSSTTRNEKIDRRQIFFFLSFKRAYVIGSIQQGGGGSLSALAYSIAKKPGRPKCLQSQFWAGPSLFIALLDKGSK